MLNNDNFLKLNNSETIDFFCDLFYRDLESWFSADMVCCSNCYNDFIEKWPAIYSRDPDFQCNTIDIDTFYWGSRLQEVFSKQEYINLVEYIKCPRCNNSITDMLYPYNFPFYLDDNFESEIDEIDRIAQRTPFLLLSHSLAKEAFDTIMNMSKKTKLTKIEKKYFRARVYEDKDDNGNEKIYTEADFTPAPRDKVREGRYNHAGYPVLYLADIPKTCFLELREPEKGIMYAEIEIIEPIKVLDLLEQDDEYCNIINMIKWSSIMQSPKKGEGWYNPHYTFTRFIADCALSAGFDAIKYPSVRFNEGHNLVILDGISACQNIRISNIRKFKKLDF